MIYNNVSCKRVIAKVFSDLNLNEGDHRISDIIEYIGEALEKIGVFPILDIRCTGQGDEPLTVVENYQARLPFGLHRIIQVAWSNSINGEWLPMVRAVGSFDYVQPTIRTNSEGAVTEQQSADNIISVVMSLYNYTYEQALSFVNSSPEKESLINYLLNSKQNSIIDENTFNRSLTYYTSGGYIKTNQENGYLKVAYLCIPVDENGFPLVPDDQGFFEALYWYILTKLYYPEWKQGSLRDAVYYDARNNWNFYCKQAAGNAMMPDVDALETIKNTWLRIIPEIEEHGNFFTTLNKEQKIYNSRNYRY